MYKAEVQLMDSVEWTAFTKLMNAIEKYRAEKYQMTPNVGQTGPQTPADEEVVDAQYEADEKPDAPVIATITPAGVTKAPKPEELQAAAEKYASTHGLDQALKIVKEFGVDRVGQLKDPEKQAALFARFTS